MNNHAGCLIAFYDCVVRKPINLNHLTTFFYSPLAQNGRLHIKLEFYAKHDSSSQITVISASLSFQIE